MPEHPLHLYLESTRQIRGAWDELLRGRSWDEVKEAIEGREDLYARLEAVVRNPRIPISLIMNERDSFRESVYPHSVEEEWRRTNS